jgi:hypothetical protein
LLNAKINQNPAKTTAGTDLMGSAETPERPRFATASMMITITEAAEIAKAAQRPVNDSGRCESDG